jgi:hypothetical protein
MNWRRRWMRLHTANRIRPADPIAVLAKVLGINEPELSTDPYAQIPQIKDKIKIGELVTNEMTNNEAKNFPLVPLIIDGNLKNIKRT